MIYYHLKKILPPIVNPVIFEIGAHIGTDTVKIASLLQVPALYVAFEPDHRDFSKLNQAAREIDGLILFSFQPRAISNQSNRSLFHLSDGTIKDRGGRQFTDASSLKKPKGNVIARPWIRFNKTVMVDCITLDTFCQRQHVNHIDFIWADIQGSELDMIEGGQGILRNTRYLYTECQEGMYHGQPGLKKILAALPGWEIVWKTKTDVLLRNTKC